MVKYCEPYKTAREAFESAEMHQIVPELGRCQVGRIHGVWYCVWGR